MLKIKGEIKTKLLNVIDYNVGGDQGFKTKITDTEAKLLSDIKVKIRDRFFLQ